jgi:hypothetical protein
MINPSSMTTSPRQLRELLLRIARVAESFGAKGQAQAVDLRALAEVLGEEPASSVSEAFLQIRSRLAHFGKRRSSSPARGTKKSKRSTLPVEEYVRQLESAREESEIHPLLQAFRDRSFKKDELDKIAHRFAKGPEKYKTKAEAIEDIEERFFERRRSSNEIDFLEKKKVTPW